MIYCKRDCFFFSPSSPSSKLKQFRWWSKCHLLCQWETQNRGATITRIVVVWACSFFVVVVFFSRVCFVHKQILRDRLGVGWPARLEDKSFQWLARERSRLRRRTGQRAVIDDLVGDDLLTLDAIWRYFGGCVGLFKFNVIIDGRFCLLLHIF